MAFRDLVGQELGPSSWLVVTQAQVDEFARATGDDQWIHVDPERCAKESPFGRTIAHGYLTLSLCAVFVDELVPEDGAYSLSINYGSNRVRFPAPVPVGSRIRGRVRFDALDEVAGGEQATFTVTVECDQSEKPVCVAEIVYRYVF